MGQRDSAMPPQANGNETRVHALVMRHPATHWLPWLLFGLTCAFVALDFLFLVLSWATPVPDTWGFRGDAAIVALAICGVGQLLARRRPQNPIGWLFLVAGLSAGIYRFGVEYSTYVLLTQPGTLPGGTLAAWTASWLWFVTIGPLIYVFLLFPTGHLPSKRWRPVAWVVVSAFALMAIVNMLKPGPLYFAPYLDNPGAFAGSGQAVDLLSQIAGASMGLGILLVGASVILRLRHAQGIERQQLKWFVYAAALLSVIGVIDAVGSSVIQLGPGPKFFQLLTLVIWIAIPLTVGLAILRYQLWDIDLIINRTLVYGTLTASIVAIYILLIAGLGTLLQTSGNLFISLLATALIAVLFQPWRERLQGGVNRLIYGERDDPYSVLSRLGQRLEATLEPGAVLPTIVETVAQALKLPYAGIALKEGDEFQVAAEYPTPHSVVSRNTGGKEPAPSTDSPHRVEVVPLTYQSEVVGQLLLTPRAPGEAFSAADRRLLEQFALRAGIAAHALRLTRDLQHSRSQLVTAREEERRRIRRDLHDGLGPVLASLAMQADNAREWTRTDPDQVEATLVDITANAQEALQDIRRLVYDLRPPALDDLGLLGALRQLAANFPASLHIEIDARDRLPPLSAAVEVAAYRITQEALNNVMRHSGARNCTVRVCVEGELRLTIDDDGLGLRPDVRAGVGLVSMRERAMELGGSCVIESAPDGGTRIFAHLPLALEREKDG